MQQEQSVAEILSSIRQVLSREAATLNTANTTQIQPVREDVYELTPQMQLSAGRLVTPQTAMKTQAALEQLRCIKYLEFNYPLEKLDSKILMVMKVRKKYPEHSLTQLLDVIHDEYDPNLSKSGLNHRLRKIKELAKDLAAKKKEIV